MDLADLNPSNGIGIPLVNPVVGYGNAAGWLANRENLAQQTGQIANQNTLADIAGKQQTQSFAAQDQPYNLQTLAAKAAYEQQQTRQLSMTNDVNSAVGVPTLASGKEAEIQSQKTKTSQEQMDAFYKEYINMAPELDASPNSAQDKIHALAQKYNLPEGAADAVTQHATLADQQVAPGMGQGAAHQALAQHILQANPQYVQAMATESLRSQTSLEQTGMQTRTEQAVASGRITAEQNMQTQKLLTDPTTAPNAYANMAAQAAASGDQEGAKSYAAMAQLAKANRDDAVFLGALARVWSNPNLAAMGVPTVGSTPGQPGGLPNGVSPVGGPGGQTGPTQGQVNGPDGKPVRYTINPPAQQAGAAGAPGIPAVSVPGFGGGGNSPPVQSAAQPSPGQPPVAPPSPAQFQEDPRVVAQREQQNIQMVADEAQGDPARVRANLAMIQKGMATTKSPDNKMMLQRELRINQLALQKILSGEYQAPQGGSSLQVTNGMAPPQGR